MEPKQHQDAGSIPQASREKAAWTTPQLATLDAADAELGVNPVNPEGAFAVGS